MTAPATHMAIEVLFDTVWAPACENTAGLDCFDEGDPDAVMTDDEAQVTCSDCLRAMGFDVCPVTNRVRVAA